MLRSYYKGMNRNEMPMNQKVKFRSKWETGAR